MRAAKQLTLLFLVTLFTYVAAFIWIEHRRVKNGPWQITFTAEAGVPAIVINQLKLKIRDCKLVFPAAPPAASPAQTVKFDSARPVPFAVPYGQCIFQDTISLPGNVTLQIFGHEIQLLPRTLTVDKKEIPWQSGDMIPIPPK